MTDIKNYRHGDVALIGVKTMPRVKASKTDIFMSKGSGGLNHTFTGGIFYPNVDGDNIVGYLKAKGTTLYHPEHSPKGVNITDGIYEVRKQNEFTHEGLREVID